MLTISADLNNTMQINRSKTYVGLFFVLEEMYKLYTFYQFSTVGTVFNISVFFIIAAFVMSLE